MEGPLEEGLTGGTGMSTKVHILLALTDAGREGFRAARTAGKARAPGRTAFDNKGLAWLSKALGAHGFETVGSEIIAIGTAGWSQARRQCHTKALLRMARDRAEALTDWHVKVLLLTDADIYDTDTVFVAGQAEVNGRAAVVSFARLGAADEGRFLRRVLKETMHELGHTIGLGHCRDHDCVMFPSRVLADSDVKDHALCQRCRTKAGRALAPDRQAIMPTRQ